MSERHVGRSLWQGLPSWGSHLRRGGGPRWSRARPRGGALEMGHLALGARWQGEGGRASTRDHWPWRQGLAGDHHRRVLGPWWEEHHHRRGHSQRLGTSTHCRPGGALSSKRSLPALQNGGGTMERSWAPPSAEVSRKHAGGGGLRSHFSNGLPKPGPWASPPSPEHESAGGCGGLPWSWIPPPGRASKSPQTTTPRSGPKGFRGWPLRGSMARLRRQRRGGMEREGAEALSARPAVSAPRREGDTQGPPQDPGGATNTGTQAHPRPARAVPGPPHAPCCAGHLRE